MVDETSTISVTMFTEEAEVLFRMIIADIYHMKHSGDRGAFKRTEEFRRTTHVLVEAELTTAFSRNKILQWVPKKDVMEVDEKVAPDKPEELDSTSAHSDAKIGLHPDDAKTTKEISEESMIETVAPLKKKITRPRRETREPVIGIHKGAASSYPNEVATGKPLGAPGEDTTTKDCPNPLKILGEKTGDASTDKANRGPRLQEIRIQELVPTQASIVLGMKTLLMFDG